jgi:hypothetical protein
MDKLSDKELKELKKNSTQRLIAMLVCAGQDEAKIPLDRTELLDMVAELKVSGKSVSIPVDGATGGNLSEAERQEIRWQEERALRQQELAMRREEIACRKADEKSLIARTKMYSEAIKNIFPVLPQDSAELPMYLDNVDNLFEMYEVPTDLRSKLLLPHLSGKVKSVVSKMSLDELNDYDVIKHNILKEFNITSRELHSRFMQANKRRDESFCVFRGRLELLLKHYLRSREVEDFADLVDLLITDRLKDCLSEDVLKYVLSLEGSDSHDSHKVAANADVFTANYFADGTYKGNHVTNLSLYGKGRGGKQFYKQRFGQYSRESCSENVLSTSPQEEAVVKSAKVASTSVSSKPHGEKQFAKSSKRVCFCCKSEEHMVNKCPHRKPGVYYKNPWSIQSGPKAGKQVNSTETAEVNNAVNAVQSESKIQGNTCGVINKVLPNKPIDVVVDCDHVKQTDIVISPLKYIDVVINGKVHSALIDGGAEVPLIKSSLLQDVSSIGSVHIQPIVGKSVEAKLAVLDVAKFDSSDVDCDACDTCVHGPMHVVFAVTDLASQDVVLPEAIVTDLHKTSHKCKHLCKDNEFSINCCIIATNNIVLDKSDSARDVDKDPETVDDALDDVINVDLLDSDEHECFGKRHELILQQVNDDSLKACRSMADNNKNGYYWKDGILFHKDRVLNQIVEQLVVPQSRRRNIVEFAHNSCFHQGHKKTSERIRFSFTWPSLKSDVINFVSSCEPCQLRRKLVVKDRVPIAPVERPGLPGEHLMMDIIGPIEPTSSTGHKYILNVICMHTRWPFAYLLKNLTAKSVCESLSDVFSHIGVASVISSDCGSNFTSSLTTYFLNVMGCSPRFNSPAHPEASGAVERFNGSFKRMLHHAIASNKRQWHKCVPFIIWAMRESGNTTVGLPPYTLLYGHKPRGPLQVLKESWTGSKLLPPRLKKSEVQYMQELKRQLEMVRDYAEQHAEQSQADYVYNYNKRAKNKSFEIGEKVIVLFGDSTCKLQSKWQTGVIHDVVNENSYLVDLPNGGRRQIHANHLRPFTIRVNSVIASNDQDFGDIVSVPCDDGNDQLPSTLIDKKCIEHLSEQQQFQLLQVLDDFHMCFSEKPGLCTNVVHEIITTDDFVPKQFKPYKIPEILKPEVEKQIEVLLKQGFIVPSNSDMVSPIVCVVKHDSCKTGSMKVRLVCDLRYLNRYTRFDPYPVPDQEEVMNKLASFQFITVFDARASYWQTMVKQEHQWLLGFATHHGIWQWTRTPFGAKNSGATFCRAIKRVLMPVQDISASYVDDMGIGSHTWENHLINLRRFLSVIKNAGITLNLLKAEFAKPNVKFIGHIVGSGLKRIDPDKIASIVAIERPTTQRQLKRFLGMMTYHRSFVDHFSQVAKPLTDLTSVKYSKFLLPWSSEQESAFCLLKDKLSNVVGQSIPRLRGLFILRCDASKFAISGCLYQRNDDCIEDVKVTGDGEYPISFYSQKLNSSQINWSTIEKEAYAVVASLQKFEHIIFGSCIIVYSDHNPLSYLVDCVTHSAKLTRWSMALQQYNLIFRYAKAQYNVVADFFSRT